MTRRDEMIAEAARHHAAAKAQFARAEMGLFLSKYNLEEAHYHATQRNYWIAEANEIEPTGLRASGASSMEDFDAFFTQIGLLSAA